jgi:hypothetical protein
MYVTTPGVQVFAVVMSVGTGAVPRVSSGLLLLDVLLVTLHGTELASHVRTNTVRA